MQWSKLLSFRRLGETDTWPYDPSRSPWQVDYDRVIFSSAFRRLQDKTQVHPLSGSDYVRTRLTHSLEVASVARTLGTRVGAHVLSRQPQGELNPSDFGMITAAAALTHDIGNPPFGHSGEDAIRYWFSTSPVAQNLASSLTAQQKRDFDLWEGNAEGFRILARLQFNRNKSGMRLTTSTLAAFMKYPTGALAANSDSKFSDKKPGFFEDDRALWQEVANDVGLIPDGTKDQWCRHPLAYLTEAADDICYRLIDLEDGLRLGLISYQEFHDLCKELIPTDKVFRISDFTSDREKASYLRALAIGTLMDEVVEQFKAKEVDLMEGRPTVGLLDDSKFSTCLKSMKNLTKQKVYSSTSVLQIEAAGFEIIPGLLDAFVEAMEQVTASNKGPEKKKSTATKNKNLKAAKLLRLLPAEALAERPSSDSDLLPYSDPYQRLLAAVDYVAGMTDTYALDIFRKIRGVTIPR